MLNTVRFYSICFVDSTNNTPTPYSVFDFLVHLNELLLENVNNVKRSIGDKHIRCFEASVSHDGYRRIAMPIGRKKNGTSYVEDNNARSIREVDYNIFDVNSIYYDERKHILLMTCDQRTPSYRVVEAYLNLFWMQLVIT